MDSKRLIRETKLASIILILLVAFGVLLILSQLLFYDKKPENFGVIGDAVSGILNPIIAIAGALLTFLAFYIQKLANDELKNQFIEQRKKEHEDFLFKNYKERIMLIIDEINAFNISFHGGSLISGIDLLTDAAAKKYNFVGIQAINLYLIEYFNLKEKKRIKGKIELSTEDSYHAIFFQISNLITVFYHTHIEIENSEMEKSYKAELLELLNYTYYTKFCYFFEFLKKQYLPEKLSFQINHLYDHYKNINKK